MSTPRLPPWATTALGAAVPWIWFLVRGIGGRVEAVAVALPMLVLVAFVVLAVVTALLREPRLLAVLGSLVIFGAVAIVAPRLPHASGAPSPSVRLVSANVFFDNTSPAEAVESVLATRADVEVLVETSPELRAILAARDTAHPYAVQDDQLVVRSRFPLSAMPDPAGLPTRRILRLGVDAPSGPFVLYAIHALNPLSESTFANQLDWVDRLRSSAAREDLPVVMAGDFNMSDRQLGYRRMTDGLLRDAITGAGWGRSTYPYGIWAALVLRIDHVFEPTDWCSGAPDTFAVPGSDHAGLEVDVGPCP
jgi:endonuclease/exonuclease/phosphatase (EEP) superfamily protein YafD